jgi:hypothetical protein
MTTYSMSYSDQMAFIVSRRDRETWRRFQIQHTGAAATHKVMNGMMTARFVMSSEAPLTSGRLIPECVVEVI